MLKPMGCFETPLMGAYFAPTNGNHGVGGQTIIFLRTSRNPADANGIVAITDDNTRRGVHQMKQQAEIGWINGISARVLAPLIDTEKIRLTGG
jgi:hypothetical protein